MASGNIICTASISAGTPVEERERDEGSKAAIPVNIPKAMRPDA
jgi:hypothetical protein